MGRLFDIFGVTYKQGEVIFRENDPADCLYMINKGVVAITKSTGSKETTLKTLGEREFFGEMAVINQRKRSANAIALTDCELIRMDEETFNQIIRENHHFAVSVIKLLSDRLRHADEEIARGRRRDHITLLNHMFHEIGLQKHLPERSLLGLKKFMDTFMKDRSWSLARFMEALDDLEKAGMIHLTTDDTHHTLIELTLRKNV